MSMSQSSSSFLKNIIFFLLLIFGSYVNYKEIPVEENHHLPFENWLSALPHGEEVLGLFQPITKGFDIELWKKNIRIDSMYNARFLN